MKIEKVNDHQIRCTLTKADLADRELKLSELAYGTEKAKNLFRDMMQQAAIKFGFEAEDIPLMIEAIPLNGDCIVLIITKVEDPEELDTRFSKFAPSLHEGEEDLEDIFSNITEAADDVLDLFKKIKGNSRLKEETSSDTGSKNADDALAAEGKEILKIFSFSSLNQLICITPSLAAFYDGVNSLYKDEKNRRYLLSVSQSGQTPENFNRVCNILSEHGQMERFAPTIESYMEEHFGVLVKERAIQALTEVAESSR